MLKREAYEGIADKYLTIPGNELLEVDGQTYDDFRAFVESNMGADNQPRLYGERDAAGSPS